MAAPTYYAVHAEFLGRSAHAGIRPEEGRSAIVAAAKAIESMQLGRIDEETTANVGSDRRRHGGERRARALHGRGGGAQPRRRQGRGGGRSEMVDALTWAASATETDVDTTIEEQFRAYRIPESDPDRRGRAAAALRDCGIEPRAARRRGGGSDANAFEAKGFRCLNIANGTEANHTPRRARDRARRWRRCST